MKKVMRIFLWVGFVFFVGGLGSLFLEQIIMPKLATYERTQNWPLVRSVQERTTIIERTQQVQITQNDVTRNVLSQLRNSIVMVTSSYAGITKSGSGVFVTNDGVIAVAGDVVIDHPDATTTVFFATGESLDAVRVVRDAITDIVFVYVDGVREHPAISFARIEDLFAGQRVIEVGVDARVYDYVYAFTTQMQAFVTAMQAGSSQVWEGTFDAMTTGRQSGSVLVTDRGELAAIAGQSIDGTEGEILPVSAVQFALARLVDDRADDVMDIGIVYRSVTPVTLIDDAYGHGVIVESVVQNGLGAQAGVRVGDHIIAVGTEQLSPYRTLPVLLDAQHDAVINITVLRDGAEVVLTFPHQKESII